MTQPDPRPDPCPNPLPPNPWVLVWSLLIVILGVAGWLTLTTYAVWLVIA